MHFYGQGDPAMGMKQEVKRRAAGMDEMKTNVCDIISAKLSGFGFYD